MISPSELRFGVARVQAFRRESLVARLRRAGFADLERTPRRPFHWANR